MEEIQFREFRNDNSPKFVLVLVKEKPPIIFKKIEEMLLTTEESWLM